MPRAIEAARARATVGEMSDALATHFGRHQARINGVRGVWKRHMHGVRDIEILKDRVESFVAATGRPPRILVAKLGQDGHDRGQKVIASAFADLGFEVTTGPLFQSPDEVYDLAIAHDVDAVGVSTLAASHLNQVPALRRRLDSGEGGISSLSSAALFRRATFRRLRLLVPPQCFCQEQNQPTPPPGFLIFWPAVAISARS